MKLLILITFVFITQLVKAQSKLYNDIDSAQHQYYIDTYYKDALDSFLNVRNVKTVRGRFTFLMLWMYKYRLGRACDGVLDIIDDTDKKISEKFVKYIYINADSCKSIFDYDLPDTLYNYTDNQQIKLVRDIGNQIFSNVFGKEWQHQTLVVNVKVKDKYLDAFLFNTKRGVNIEQIEIRDTPRFNLVPPAPLTAEERKIKKRKTLAGYLGGVLMCAVTFLVSSNR